MTTLKQAPLIEVIFEIRWASARRESEGQVHFEFGEDDTKFFLGAFRKAAVSAGFPFVEATIDSPGLPFMVTHRFRKNKNTWPCFQIGTGIFTANQVNEFYDWKKFSASVLKGLEILNEGHPRGLAGLQGIGAELTFIDGFKFVGDETPSSFIEEKLEVGFSIPSALQQHESLGSGLHSQLAFGFRSLKPPGELSFDLNRGTISEAPGLILNTRVRSTDGDCPRFVPDNLGSWLDDAHELQRHAFRTLIKPAQMEKFK